MGILKTSMQQSIAPTTSGPATTTPAQTQQFGATAGGWAQTAIIRK